MACYASIRTEYCLIYKPEYNIKSNICIHTTKLAQYSVKSHWKSQTVFRSSQEVNKIKPA